MGPALGGVIARSGLSFLVNRALAAEVEGETKRNGPRKLRDPFATQVDATAQPPSTVDGSTFTPGPMVEDTAIL